MIHYPAHSAASPEQLTALGNIVILSGVLNTAMYVLIISAIIVMQRAVTDSSLRLCANILGGISAAAVGYSLFCLVEKGIIFSLYTLLFAADLYYLYELYDEQSGNFVSDGAKTASSILITLNGFLVALSIARLFTIKDYVSTMR